MAVAAAFTREDLLSRGNARIGRVWVGRRLQRVEILGQRVERFVGRPQRHVRCASLSMRCGPKSDESL